MRLITWDSAVVFVQVWLRAVAWAMLAARRSPALLKAAVFSCLSLKIDLEIPHAGLHRSAADCGRGENSQTSPPEIEATVRTISTSPRSQMPRECVLSCVQTAAVFAVSVSAATLTSLSPARWNLRYLVKREKCRIEKCQEV